MIDPTQLFDRLLDCAGQTLTIKQCYLGDVGCVVWDAALVLSKFLEASHFPSKYRGVLAGECRVIELGAGTGVVGLVASLFGAQVTITDLKDIVPLIQLNIDTNRSLIKGSLTAKALKWGNSIEDFMPHPDLILLSDCVYYSQAVDDLVKTLGELCGAQTEIFCSYEERSIGQNLRSLKRFLELVNNMFVVDEVPLDKQDPVYRSEDIHILSMKKR